MKSSSPSRAASVLLSLSLIAPREAVAEDAFEFFQEEASITVASARPETVFNSVSNVTVISREQIERYNYETVAEALHGVSGVMVWRTYNMQHIPTFRGALQEHYANKVLIMINNVPAWHAVTGEGDIDRVGIDSVERIEILRGPASVLYGSNALNGAINIVLREAPKEGRLTSASAGVATAHGGFAGAAEVSRIAGLYARDKQGSKLAVSADYSSVRAPRFAFTDETNQTFQLREYLNAKNITSAWTSGRHKLLANLSNSEQNYLGNSISLVSGAQQPHEKELILLHYAYGLGPEWGGLKYSATVDRQRRQIPRNDANSLRSDILGTRYSSELASSLPLSDSLTLDLGGRHDYSVAEHYNNFVTTSQAVTSDNKMDNRIVWVGSLHAQLAYAAARWKLALGTRFTHNSIFGQDFSSRFSAVYAINDRNSLKFMAGQAFRAPTPFELYFQNSPTTVLGNPGLSPEKTSSAELSYLSSWDRLFAQATLYHQDYHRSIFRNVGNFTRDGVAFANTNYYENASRYSAQGAELELRYSGPQLGAFTALNYIQGTRGDERTIAGVGGLAASTSSNFKHVPHLTFSSGLSYMADNPIGRGSLFGSLTSTYYGSMDTLRTRLPRQAWADLSLGYKIGSFKHTLTLHNVTDSRIVVPEYVRQRIVESLPLVNGRRINYTVSYRF